MQIQLPTPNPRFHEKTSRRATTVGACLALLLLHFVASTAQALNHRPTISSIPNQSVQTGAPPAPQFFNPTFFASDDLTSIGTSNIMVTVDSTAWYSNTITVTDNMNGSFTLSLSGQPTTTAGMVTVTVKVTDGPGLSISTSFTLQKYAGSTPPPKLGGIPDITHKKQGSALDPINFISASNASPTPSATPPYIFSAAVTSGDPTLVTGFSFTNVRTVNALTVTPANKSGTATITVTLGTNSSPSTPLNISSFVFDSRPGDAPEVSAGGTFMAVPPAPSPTPTPMPFTVTAHTVAYSDLVYTATSSNPALVPNSSSSFTFVQPTSSNHTGSIQINPASGVKGASTITVEVSDGSYIQRAQFLYVVEDASLATKQFAHAKGIFVLDGPTGTCTPTTIGCADFRDENKDDLDLPFVDGYVLRVPWPSVEDDVAPTNENDPGTYDFAMIINILQYLNSGQTVSIIFSEEPSYIADNASDTWVDPNEGNITRAAPWDSYLRARWKQLMIALGDEPTTGTDTIATDSRIAIINPGLPGGTNGIRDPLNSPLSDLNGYSGAPFSRATLLEAIEDYLTNIQDNLPGKLGQIGFWDLEDEDGASTPLTDYIRTNLVDPDPSVGLFNGFNRPRVGFWEENLSAMRPTAGLDYIAFDSMGTNVPPFSSGPDPGFAIPLADSVGDTWIGFQMLSAWSQPLQDGHVTKNLNGSPNDGLEGGFATYTSEYAEVYDADVNFNSTGTLLNTPYAANFQSWHDYLASITLAIDPPLEFDVTPASSTENDLTWSAVYGATAYKLQRKTLSSGTWGGWTDLHTVTPPDTSYADTGLSSSNSYAYRVEAMKGTAESGYVANVLLVRSDAALDGYVASTTGTPPNSSSLRAGLGFAGTQIRAIASFNTTTIGTGAAVIAGRLRFKQSTLNTAFSSFGFAMVDINSPYFGTSEALAQPDYSASADNTSPVAEFIGVGMDNWEEAVLGDEGIDNIGITSKTQFRVYMNASGSSSNYAGWYPGETSGSEPILIVSYKTP
jgi:hypothetical protein